VIKQISECSFFPFSYGNHFKSYDIVLLDKLITQS